MYKVQRVTVLNYTYPTVLDVLSREKIKWLHFVLRKIYKVNKENIMNSVQNIK